MLTINSPQGQVTNVKYHREGSGDDPNNVAMDIKIKCECFGAEALTPLLGNKSAKVFWTGKDNDLAFPHLGESVIRTKVEGCKAQIQGISLTNCNLGVFKFKPKMGGAIELSFNVSAKDVSPKQQDQLKGLLKTDVQILVEGGDIITLSASSKPDDDDDDSQADIED